MAKHQLYRGVRITPVTVTKYEVRDVTGKRLKTFAKPATAKSWIDGYLTAFNGPQAHRPKSAGNAG